MREKQKGEKARRIATEKYMLIHKHPVGPKTAERLFLLYEKLSTANRPTEVYTAGWAAVEAGLVGTNEPVGWRREMIEEGLNNWHRAHKLETKRSKAAAERKNAVPSTFQSRRIEALIALGPAMVELPGGPPTRTALENSYKALLDVAAANLSDARDERYVRHRQNHLSLAFEFDTLLTCNRLLSKRLLALPTLARADDGNNYPNETHDIQILSLNDSDIETITPMEVKSTLKPEHFKRYDAALIGGHHDLLLDDELTIGQKLGLLQAELAEQITADESLYLDKMTDSVIHSLRHYRRSVQPESDVDRHCHLQEKCTIPLARAGSLAMDLQS